jgi:thioredoxin
VREVTDASFEADVLGAAKPVVVDFWAPWCRPCEAIAPILDELERESAGRVEFVRLNVDESPLAAGQFGVLSLPTVILFADGREQETVVGARPRAHFERAFESWLGET